MRIELTCTFAQHRPKRTALVEFSLASHAPEAPLNRCTPLLRDVTPSTAA